MNSYEIGKRYERWFFGKNQHLIRQLFDYQITLAITLADEGHEADAFAIGRDSNKKLTLLELSTKPHRTHYADTGFDAHQYNKLFANFQEGNNTICFWIDVKKEKIYYSRFGDLIKAPQTHDDFTYPRFEKYSTKEIVYFHLNQLSVLKELDANDLKELNAIRIGSNHVD